MDLQQDHRIVGKVVILLEREDRRLEEVLQVTVLDLGVLALNPAAEVVVPVLRVRERSHNRMLHTNRGLCPAHVLHEEILLEREDVVIRDHDERDVLGAVNEVCTTVVTPKLGERVLADLGQLLVTEDGVCKLE